AQLNNSLPRSTLRSRGPARHNACFRLPKRKTVLERQCLHLIGQVFDDLRFSSALVDEKRINKRLSETEGVAQLASERNSPAARGQRLVRVAQHPKRKSLMDQTGNPGIVSVPGCVDAVLLRIVEAPAFLQVLPRANNHAAPEQGHAERSMRFELVPN